MDMQSLSLFAGTISSLLFVGGNVPMVWKALKTRDLHSYSCLNIILANVGNLIYWFYVVSLPVGPVWLLHTFYTVSSVVMLILYWWYSLRHPSGYLGERFYRLGWKIKPHPNRFFSQTKPLNLSFGRSNLFRFVLYWDRKLSIKRLGLKPPG